MTNYDAKLCIMEEDSVQANIHKLILHALEEDSDENKEGSVSQFIFSKETQKKADELHQKWLNLESSHNQFLLQDNLSLLQKAIGKVFNTKQLHINTKDAALNKELCQSEVNERESEESEGKEGMEIEKLALLLENKEVNQNFSELVQFKQQLSNSLLLLFEDFEKRSSKLLHKDLQTSITVNQIFLYFILNPDFLNQRINQLQNNTTPSFSE